MDRKFVGSEKKVAKSEVSHLDDTLAGLWHGNGSAPGNEHGLAATHVGQDPVEVALHYDHLGGQDGFFRCCLLRVGIEHLLVPKSHLSAGVP